MTVGKINSTEKNNLNRMNRAAKDADLGDWIFNAPISGSWAATSAEASASKITIATNLTTIRGQVVQVYRSGSPISGSSVYVQASGSKLIIVPEEVGFKIAASDQVNYIVF
jgi:hypothetical protein